MNQLNSMKHWYLRAAKTKLPSQVLLAAPPSLEPARNGATAPRRPTAYVSRRGQADLPSQSKTRCHNPLNSCGAEIQVESLKRQMCQLVKPFQTCDRHPTANDRETMSQAKHSSHRLKEPAWAYLECRKPKQNASTKTPLHLHPSI